MISRQNGTIWECMMILHDKIQYTLSTDDLKNFTTDTDNVRNKASSINYIKYKDAIYIYESTRRVDAMSAWMYRRRPKRETLKTTLF